LIPLKIRDDIDDSEDYEHPSSISSPAESYSNIKAAVKIQAKWRMVRERRRYKKRLNAIKGLRKRIFERYY
jgi:IQ calmodulin-binding motif